VLLWADRTNFSVAAAAWAKEYDWKPATIGTMLSAFSLGYLILQPIGGWIVDKAGARRTLAGSMAGWSLWMLLTPLAPTVLWLTAVFRVLLGAFEAPYIPASLAAVAREQGVTSPASGRHSGQLGASHACAENSVLSFAATRRCAPRTAARHAGRGSSSNCITSACGKCPLQVRSNTYAVKRPHRPALATKGFFRKRQNLRRGHASRPSHLVNGRLEQPMRSERNAWMRRRPWQPIRSRS
jgi:hypothetical protein